MTQPPFTLQGYRTTIEGLTSRGYEVCSFHDARARERHLILRHDVDQSIAVARTLSDFEREHGWRSTWFILVRTEMYNPFSRKNTGHLRAMMDAGHEIGLHLDATYYDTPKALDTGAAIECRMLEDILAKPVRLISFHRPAQSLIGGNQPVAGRPHTYMDKFTKQIGYSSDSRGEWRHGHAWQHDAVAKGQALQLLTHAVWWVGADGRSPVERLADVMALRTAEIDAELAANNQVWARRAATHEQG